jgi:hypothetical protein
MTWLQPGTLLFDSTAGCVGRTIRLFTCSRLTHVRAVCWIDAEEIARLRPMRRFVFGRPLNWHDRLCVVESTFSHPEPCLLMRHYVAGVQVHETKVARCTWAAVPNGGLSPEESFRFTEFLLDQVGTPYDFAGAGLAGTTLLKRICPWAHRIQSPYYCNELVGRALLYALQGRRLPEFQPGEQSPRSFARFLVRSGLYHPLERIK